MIARLFLPLWLLLLVAFACQPHTPAAARITLVSGPVTIKPAARAAVVQAEANAALYLDDVVTTGANGHVTITFVGGNSVELAANTSMLIRQSGGASAEVGAVLLSGSAKATSGDKGIRLAIGTPLGLAEVGGTAADGKVNVTVLDISFEKGIQVEVGSVVLTQEDGKQKELAAGQSLEIPGLSVKVEPKKAVEEVVLAPLTFTLLSDPKQTLVKAQGEKSWHPPKKHMVLKAGDSVRTKKAEGRVDFTDSGALTLRPDSEVTFTKAGGNAAGDELTYQLTSGGATLTLAHGAKAVQHVLKVAGHEVAIAPGLKDAKVEIVRGKNGSAEVVVRTGQVTVDKAPMDPGTALDLSEGKAAPPARPLATSHIDLNARANAILYFDHKVPPVTFTWGGDLANQACTFELSQDRDFAKTLITESTKRGSYVDDQLAPGHYWWRVAAGKDAQHASLQVMQESENDCPNCKRTNAIDDTGEKTVVYFQQALPAIILRWKEVENAVSYKLRVFADGEFDTPLFDEPTKELKRGFTAGQFKEGKYYWLIISYDSAGKELSTGRMNSLQIAYDNAITALVIRVPKAGVETVSAAKITTTGEAELGARVSLNGKRIEVDSKGRFSEDVPLHLGVNDLVYRALTGDGVERFYVRQVLRR